MVQNDSKFLVVSGCYDGGLVGLECTIDNEFNSVEFNLIFKFLAHQGSVKTISFGDDFLATGGNDETVCLYDIKKRVTFGSIQLCKGTITALAWQHDFCRAKKLLVATNNGKIYLFRAHDLEKICELNAHDGQVNDIAVHPKGKVFISLGKDSKLKLWDLVTNLCVYSTTLNTPAFSIAFSNEGSNYAFISDRNCTISSVTNEFKPLVTTVGEILTCVTFMEEDKVLLGTNRGNILSWLFLQENQSTNVVKHGSRVKSIKTACINDKMLVITANSNGEIHILKCIGSTLDEIGTFKTETRLITCAISTTLYDTL